MRICVLYNLIQPCLLVVLSSVNFLSCRRNAHLLCRWDICCRKPLNNLKQNYKTKEPTKNKPLLSQVCLDESALAHSVGCKRL